MDGLIPPAELGGRREVVLTRTHLKLLENLNDSFPVDAEDHDHER